MGIEEDGLLSKPDREDPTSGIHGDVKTSILKRFPDDQRGNNRDNNDMYNFIKPQEEFTWRIQGLML